MKGEKLKQEHVADIPFAYYFPKRVNNPRLAKGQEWEVADTNIVFLILVFYINRSIHLFLLLQRCKVKAPAPKQGILMLKNNNNHVDFAPTCYATQTTGLHLTCLRLTCGKTCTEPHTVVSGQSGQRDPKQARPLQYSYHEETQPPTSVFPQPARPAPLPSTACFRMPLRPALN